MKSRRIVSIVLILLLIWGILYGVWHILPLHLSKMLSDKAKVRVDINYLSVSPWRIRLKGISVDNPPGAILEKALEIKELSSHAFLTQYMKDQVHISKLEIDNVVLGLEFDSATSTNGNWTRIMKNLSSDSASEPSSKASAKEKTIFIETLTLRNIRVNLVFRTGNQKINRLPVIPEITLYNVSTEGNDLAVALANSILGQMLQNVFIKENLNNMLKDLLNTPGNSLNKFLSPFQKLLQ